MRRILFFFIFTVVVLPNAFRPFKYLILCLSLFILIKQINKNFFKKYNPFLFLGLSISILYIAIGHFFSKQPYISFFQSLAVYVVFPSFWILFSDYILRKYSPKKILNYLTILGVLSCVSIFASIWLLDNGYYDIMSKVIENPKKTVSTTGVIEVRLNVYGSLLFLIPAIISSFKLYSLPVKFFLISFILVSIVYSGRSILILSFLIGVLGYLVQLKNGFKTIFALIIFFIVGNIIVDFFDLPLQALLDASEEKINSEEDNVRKIQFWLFLTEIKDYLFFFGHGHGVGIDFVRHAKFHWRGYELLIMATVFRTGIIGLVIYSLPFFYSIRKYVRLYKKKMNNQTDNFFAFGMIGVVAGVFSNPYLESFDFQFLFFISFCYFINRNTSFLKKIKKSFT